MGSKREEFCKERFNSFLVDIKRCENVQWEKGDEPPDYYLSIGSNKYAVEVTTIMDILKVAEKEFPILSILNSMRQLTKSIEQKALDQNILQGHYFIKFNRPFPNFGRIKKVLEKRILDFLSKTTNFSKSSEINVFEQNSFKCIVKKINRSLSVIGFIGPTRVKYEEEIQAEACRLFNRLVSLKAKKLQKIQFGKILLLLNQYQFSEKNIYINCISYITNLNHFHAIFIVDPKGVDHILYESDEFIRVLKGRKNEF